MAPPRCTKSTFILTAAVCIGGLAIVATDPPAAQAQQFQDETLTRFPQPDLAESTNQLTVGDIDNDGDLDLIFANGGDTALSVQTLRIFINDGTGVFTDESDARTGDGTLLSALTFLARGVELGDIERDGDLDVIVAQDFNRQPALLVNDGKGFFVDESAARLPALTFSSSRGQFADVDNDGDLDLYFTNGGMVNQNGAGRGKLYLNNGSGVYTDATTTNTVNQNITEPSDCIFGDIDGDLDLDLRVASTFGGAQGSKLYRNNGLGVFVLSGAPADNNCESYDFGDVNGDGDLDLLGANAHSTMTNNELLLNNSGTGTFTASTWTGSNALDNDSKFFDYDNDGDLDIFIASLGANERVYVNSGVNPPAFALDAGAITAVADPSLDIKVADLNGDGRYDLVTAQGENVNPLLLIDRIYINVSGPIDNRAPVIANTQQLPDTSSGGPFVVRAVIYDAHTSDRGFHDKGVQLNYSVDGGNVEQVEMAWSGNSLWRGVIPAQTASGTVTYFVTATDYASNAATGPAKLFDIEFPCPADFNNDSQVDVLDLLAVIGNWGALGATHNIGVQDFAFVPSVLAAKSGDTLKFNWVSGIHTATSGSSCQPNGMFDQPITAAMPTLSYEIPVEYEGALPYYCTPHCFVPMTGSVNVTRALGEVNGDGEVNVLDLLGVIGAWGPCQ